MNFVISLLESELNYQNILIEMSHTNLALAVCRRAKDRANEIERAISILRDGNNIEDQKGLDEQT